MFKTWLSWCRVSRKTHNVPSSSSMKPHSRIENWLPGSRSFHAVPETFSFQVTSTTAVRLRSERKRGRSTQTSYIYILYYISIYHISISYIIYQYIRYQYDISYINMLYINIIYHISIYHITISYIIYQYIRYHISYINISYINIIYHIGIYQTSIGYVIYQYII